MAWSWAVLDRFLESRKWTLSPGGAGPVEEGVEGGEEEGTAGEATLALSLKLAWPLKLACFTRGRGPFWISKPLAVEEVWSL